MPLPLYTRTANILLPILAPLVVTGACVGFVNWWTTSAICPSVAVT